MKQDAFAVVPYVVRETRPFLALGSVAGSTKNLTMAVSCVSGLPGKTGQVGEVDACRSSRRGFVPILCDPDWNALQAVGHVLEHAAATDQFPGQMEI